MRKGKKIASALTALVFLIGGLVYLGSNTNKVSAFTGSGSGVGGDPFIISNCNELQSMNDSSSDENALYWLAGDIDCSGIANFVPIINYFNGTLDGRNHTISNLTIDRSAEDYVGLFSRLDNDALITNLYFDNTVEITGGENVGTIAGYANYSTIRDVHSSADIVGNVNAGGLIGSTNGWQDDMQVSVSSFEGTVNSSNYAGGIVGNARYGFMISDVLVDADITGTDAGGVIGYMLDSCGYRYINNAFVAGTISADNYAGGFIGKSENISCYDKEINDSVSLATLTGTATKGGAIGLQINSSVTTTNTYFDETASDTTDCTGSGTATTCTDIGLNVAPLDEPYAQWNLTDVWQEDGGTITSLKPQSFLQGPSVVTNISAIKGEEKNSVDISWEAPTSNGGFDINYYRIEIKKSSDTWDNLVDSDTTSDFTNSFYNLNLDTTYDIRINAKTEYTAGLWSAVEYQTPTSTKHYISSCEQLMAVDDESNDTILDPITLISDIDCSGIANFEPIGSSDAWDGSPYRGIFNGQGYTISNLTIDIDDYEVGLFTSTNKATIRNVILSGGSVSGYGDVGAVVGESDDSNLSNIHSDLDVFATDDDNVGGIVGNVDQDSGEKVFEHLSSTGDVTGIYGRSGGLIGSLDVEEGKSFTLKKSYASGDVSSTEFEDNYGTGGLIGDIDYGYDDDDITLSVVIEDSYATGDVTGYEEVGGLIGRLDNYDDDYDSTFDLVLQRTYATGDVTGSEDVGGLIGQLDGLDEDDYSMTIQNNFAAGAVTGEALGDYGAFVGYYYSGDIDITSNSNYFDSSNDIDDCTGSESFDDCNPIDEGAEPNYFKNNISNPPLDTWDFDTIWLTKTDGYPVLRPYTLAEIDTDNDNIPDSLENAGPNGGDANNDGILDSIQVYVSSFVNSVTGKYAVIEISEECSLTSSSSQAESANSVQDSGFDYPAGLLNFTASCGTNGFTTTVKQYYYDQSNDGLVIRKYNPNTDAYFNLIGAYGAEINQTTIDNSPVATVTYLVQDGGDLDIDSATDGNIADPAGLAESIVGSPNTGFSN